MSSIRFLARKYADHEFIVSRQMDRFGRRYIIQTCPGSKINDVKEFANNCLGPGILFPIKCIDKDEEIWTYRLIE